MLRGDGDRRHGYKFLFAWKAIGVLVRNSILEFSGANRHVKMFGIAGAMMPCFPGGVTEARVLRIAIGRSSEDGVAVKVGEGFPIARLLFLEANRSPGDDGF